MDKEKITKEERTIIDKIKSHPYILEAVIITIVIFAIASYFLWTNVESRVYIENSEVYAPVISLSPETPGVLKKIYVSPGDNVGKHKAVALVGNQEVQTETGGIIIDTKELIGQTVSSQDAIVKMIDTKDLRVIGKIGENKGLSYIKPGQRSVFTVDAFGKKKYEGIVESVALSARQLDLTFSISDKRAERQFDIKIKFDINKYPELKNGMSAKVWVYKQQ